MFCRVSPCNGVATLSSNGAGTSTYGREETYGRVGLQPAGEQDRAPADPRHAEAGPEDPRQTRRVDDAHGRRQRQDDRAADHRSRSSRRASPTAAGRPGAAPRRQGCDGSCADVQLDDPRLLAALARRLRSAAPAAPMPRATALELGLVASPQRAGTPARARRAARASRRRAAARRTTRLASAMSIGAALARARRARPGRRRRPSRRRERIQREMPRMREVEQQVARRRGRPARACHARPTLSSIASGRSRR